MIRGWEMKNPLHHNHSYSFPASDWASGKTALVRQLPGTAWSPSALSRVWETCTLSCQWTLQKAPQLATRASVCGQDNHQETTAHCQCATVHNVIRQFVIMTCQLRPQTSVREKKCSSINTRELLPVIPFNI